ncbi:MAG: hypothetical protein EG826_10660 [Deltaproteobacteria bacterium]|nr:hypothetical protein [Deltaproteobacteria bacterium]
MKKPSLLSDYLNKYAAGPPWKLAAENLENIGQVVVIPAYAEKELIFDTLASLAANDDAMLANTLVLSVINNKAASPAADKENNAATLGLLETLVGRGSISRCGLSGRLSDALESIADRRLRLAYVDASSPGLEIPQPLGGVGMARKIGMDMALRVLKNASSEPGAILSLDADTRVQTDYLSTVRRFFSSRRTQTGVIAYAHQMPGDDAARQAICSYEIFLRYWVLGLQYARSPYAFHSIGSTIVTTTDAYLAVRGMNRREAGEDFYFLNKLAKNGPVRQIKETVVYPSARISVRVPFGTGAAVGKRMAKQAPEHTLYDPRIFCILKDWLALMNNSFDRSASAILALAKEIDAGLEAFLIGRGFLADWPKIRRNIKDMRTYERQFHTWFDGFETLKLINYLSKEYYPRVEQSSALRVIWQMLDEEFTGEPPWRNALNLEDPMNVLSHLRQRT